VRVAVRGDGVRPLVVREKEQNIRPRPLGRTQRTAAADRRGRPKDGEATPQPGDQI